MAKQNNKPRKRSTEGVGFNPESLSSEVATIVCPTEPEKVDSAQVEALELGSPQGSLPAEAKEDRVTILDVLGMEDLDCFPGYASDNFNFKSSRRQAAAAKVLASTLANMNERFNGVRSSHPDGKAVDGKNDAIRWLLDRLADEIEERTGKKLTEDFKLVF